jgi:hypothetical protein
MQITIELPEDIAAGLQSKWKDLPRAALESLALEASSAAPWFPDSVRGRRFSKGARNARLLGRGFRTGPGDCSGAPNEGGSALSPSSRPAVIADTSSK